MVYHRYIRIVGSWQGRPWGRKRWKVILLETSWNFHLKSRLSCRFSRQKPIHWSIQSSLKSIFTGDILRLCGWNDPFLVCFTEWLVMDRRLNRLKLRFASSARSRTKPWTPTAASTLAVHRIQITRRLFDIAMENGPFIDDLWWFTY